MNLPKKVISFFLAALMVFSFAVWGSAAEADKTIADLVVYGKIFTSEGNQIVEAFAVKDGKYVYVGDRKGAEAFVEKGKTEVIDYTGKGLVMSGCGNGHAHYLSAYAVQSFGTMIGFDDTVEKFMNEIVPATVKKARETGAKAVYGMGWEFQTFKNNMPTRQQLDAICSDIPMYFADEENHKSLVNTIALVNAGIMSADGTVLKKGNDIRGGEIAVGSDGTPNGFLKEQASTYVRSFLDNEALFSVDMAKASLEKVQELILSEGYTMYLDGYSSYFFNDTYYQAAQQMEKAGKLHFVLGFSYEIDSWMNINEVLDKAVAAKKYASRQIKPYWIKLFMDGTVESGTGFIEPEYPDGHQGIVNWTEEELTDMTKKANENGLIMHIHALGNKGVNRVVNAYVNGGKPEMRNTIVHLRNVNEPDYKRMADNNIYVTSGMIWHHNTNKTAEELKTILPANMSDKGYPMKSFFDYGIPVSFHTDYPALSNSPDDPFGVMEIAVTGVCYFENGDPWWPEELVTREQALTAMTIGCAKQMLIEDERGSIKTGKYADFLLVDKDVLTCPVKEIHNAKPDATYFEGKKVFSANNSDKEPADLVVYGKIFTSEGNKIVEAFAVKDGKYVYVGDKKGAEALIEKGKTEVVDYTGKGLVMPGCGNGHAHYMLGYALKTIGTTIDYEDDAEKFMNEILPAAVKKAKDTGAKAVFGQGWNLMHFGNHIPTRQELDAVCSDIPMYFLDDECHKALTNTLMLVKAGIMSADGTPLMTEIRGGEIQTDANGIPTGFLSEQAQTYVRSFLDDIYTLDMATANIAEIEQHMLSEGYTMYTEGWGNYFVNTNYYEALQQLDKTGKLHFVVGLPYEFESWMNVDEALARAVDAKKFASARVMPRWIKLLMDGTVESGTGFVDPLYPDGHQGIANWTEEEITDITRKANEKGLTLHIHAMGNKAVNYVVNAYINGGKDEMRNTIVHLASVNAEDYKRMADHNIYVSSGITWHHNPSGMAEYYREHGKVPAGQEDKSYPFKSFFDNNVHVSIHSDYPALSGSPDDPFGIMEIGVTGVLWSENGTPWWPEELVTREQALTAMTIGCARQMFLEDERGSIREGKYADFLLLNKDVLTCPAMEIHSAKPTATYFEGQKVFSAQKESDAALNEARERVRAQYGENKKITDDNYDKSLAVKCINGTFVGKKNDGVIAYKGIPFVGKQPVGNLRWKAPVDFVPDDGVYEAYYNAKSPCQNEAASEEGSLYVQGEDCLYLNVWKANDGGKKKPVMVWIHGGAFEMGGTSDPMYECSNFVRENPDVIAVSIAYRLGVFGFLHLSHLPDGKDYPDAQNLGLMDQIMALKWVHENISAFGGDPENVTLFGESAGSASVTTLPLIEGSHKYFKRVIAQSGSPSFTRSTEQAIACTDELMDKLGCKTVADLKNIDVEKLVNAADILTLRVFPENDGKYLPLDPYAAYANGAVKDIDILQGCNKDEMNYFVYFMGVEAFKKWGIGRKANYLAHMTEEEKALFESFCDDIRGEDYEYESRMLDQVFFIAPLFRLSENQTKAGGKSYTYYFTPEASSPIMRCGHAVELSSVLNNPQEAVFTGRVFDETFSKTMRKMWIQFAKTGNPSLSAEISPDGKAHEWPLYDLKNREIMVFDEFNIHPEKESERKILDWKRTYFMTKYLCM